MTPLRIAFLWHQHQPYYKLKDEFLLPWVRLHGVKDYFDLPAIVADYPSIKQTFNIVPSLLMQVEDYVRSAARDRVERLTVIPAERLSVEEKQGILERFFLCHAEKMIMPYDRYRELYETYLHGDALLEFRARDWRDLQVWYNLVWIGPISRQRASVQRYFDRERDFSESEKLKLLDIHRDILAGVTPILRRLAEKGQIELSVSPAFHPILPLLCDSEIARESSGDTTLPDARFVYPQDAHEQIRLGAGLFNERFGLPARGMWPSEGAVSNEALRAIADAGFEWTATDEQILSATLGETYRDIDKYFPHDFSVPTGEIAVLFRDHDLSDAIGFVYAHWQAADAADDFCARLENIRLRILNEQGASALERAVIPVILDGENCWEYYEGNGESFLRELFGRLTKERKFTTVTCQEAIAQHRAERTIKLQNIHPGSWINHNFSIWIGHQEENAAWDMLAAARRAVEEFGINGDAQAFDKAMQHLYVAEGSDWFWWYGDDHTTANQDDFDRLFRWRIVQAYKTCGLEPPAEALKPIYNGDETHVIVPPQSPISPIMNGTTDNEAEWRGAGYYDAVSAGGAMHRAVDIFRRMWYGADRDTIYFRFDTVRPLYSDEYIELVILVPVQLTCRLSPESIAFYSNSDIVCAHCAFAVRDIAVLALPRDLLLPRTLSSSNEEEALFGRVVIHSRHGDQAYPDKGRLNLRLH